MKTSTVFAASALVALLSLDAASAMQIFLKKFPNGDMAFTKALGHVGTTDDLNDFGNMFSAEGNEYTQKLCKSTFPGTSMTVGQAFGDPCCSWKAGGKPDFNIEPFTTPTKKTECVATVTATPAPSSAAPSGGSSASASTPAPAPAPGSGSNSSPAPANGTPSMKPKKHHKKKCHTKKDKKKEGKKN